MSDRKCMKWMDENSENPLLSHKGLYEAALDEFSRKSYNEASLNDILKTVKMNKGSFYYRFYDKMDLYLSLFHKVGISKLEFFQQNFKNEPIPSDFFDQIQLIVKMGLLFTKVERRYYDFWRNYLAEESQIHKVVRDNFSGIADDTMDDMIQAARKSGELDSSLSEAFIISVIKLLLYNIDTMISPDMDDKEILRRVDELMIFMKRGLQPAG